MMIMDTVSVQYYDYDDDGDNHDDDGNNHVKEKAQSTGRIKDILVKAGGGATDPHDNTFATNVDSVLSRWGR